MNWKRWPGLLGKIMLTTPSWVGWGLICHKNCLLEIEWNVDIWTEKCFSKIPCGGGGVKIWFLCSSWHSIELPSWMFFPLLQEDGGCEHGFLVHIWTFHLIPSKKVFWKSPTHLGGVKDWKKLLFFQIWTSNVISICFLFLWIDHSTYGGMANITSACRCGHEFQFLAKLFVLNWLPSLPATLWGWGLEMTFLCGSGHYMKS